MTLGRPRLVIHGDTNSSFVKEDIRILSVAFDVTPFHCTRRRDIPGLLRAVRTSDMCLSWFVNAYARIAQSACSWRGIPHVAIVGGYEVAWEPDLGYGSQAQRGLWGLLSRRFVLAVLGRASAIVVPSQFTQGEVLRLKRPRRLAIIPLGVDLGNFVPTEKVSSVGTIAEAQTPGDLKGLGTYMAAAAKLPDIDFHVVGRVMGSLTASAPPNVVFHGRLDHGTVAKFLGGLRVYCQLSRRESFGLATAEAMAAGCVPIVSDRGALPEVVGDAGYKVPYGNVDDTAEAIRLALGLPSPSQKARDRAEMEYPLGLRGERLKALLESVEKP